MAFGQLPPISQWTEQDAKNAVAQSLHGDYSINFKMLESKDFWQNGDLWPGNRTGDPTTDDAILANVKKLFVSDDILSECLDNYVNGLMGYEPGVMLDPLDAVPVRRARPTLPPSTPPTPTPDPNQLPTDTAPTDPSVPPVTPRPDPAAQAQQSEDKQQDEIDALMRTLSAWWDKKHLWRTMRAAIKRSRYAALRDRPNIGRGDIRVWLPPSALDRIRPAPGRPAGSAIPTGLTLEDALDRIEVDDLVPDSAVVYTDPVTREKAAVVITGQANSAQERVELWTVEGRGEEAKTVVRVLSSGDTVPSGTGSRPARVREVAAGASLPLGGRLPVIEAESDAVVTKPARDLQALLNFVLTVLPRNVETAGFKQRYLTNVEPPGMWLPTAPTNSPALETSEVGGKIFYKHRVPWTLGANITAELVGVRSLDPTSGKEVFATPGVTIETPTDPAFITNAHERVASLIYKRMKQGHFATADAAQLSGVAYQQHRAQFESDLNNGRAAAETLVRETLYVVLSYAAIMSEEARALLAKYRIVVNLHPHAGPVTPDEMRAAMDLKNGRIIAAETAMSRVGIEDTSAEQEAIDDDPSQQADLSKKKADAANAWVLAGASSLAAGLLAGLTEEEATLFERGVTEQQAQAAKLAADRAKQAADLAKAQGTANPNPNPNGNNPPTGGGNQPPQFQRGGAGAGA